MKRRNLIRNLRVALAAAMVSTLLLASAAAAQGQIPSGGLLVQVDAPAQGYRGSGNFTLTGYAIDCATGQAPSRVAVYDGPAANGVYVADVSIDTMRNVAPLCPGRTGSAQVGWTLIFDSRRLADGNHTLNLVAHFSGNRTATTSLDVFVDNYTSRPVFGGYLTGPVYPSAVYYPNGVYVDGFRSNYVIVPAGYPINYGVSIPQCVAVNANGSCVNYVQTLVPGTYSSPPVYCYNFYGCRSYFYPGTVIVYR